MGNNIDFILFGAPERIKCPNCHNTINSQLDEWDIDCSTEIEGTVFSLDVTCSRCGWEIPIRLEISCKTFIDGTEFNEKKNTCKECGKIMEEDEEIEFGECNKCSAWKYRESLK